MIRAWAESVIGIWLLISPWLMGFAGNFYAKWSQAACGLILLVMAARDLIVKDGKK